MPRLVQGASYFAGFATGGGRSEGKGLIVTAFRLFLPSCYERHVLYSVTNIDMTNPVLD